MNGHVLVDGDGEGVGQRGLRTFKGTYPTIYFPVIVTFATVRQPSGGWR
jgi:hypothetical protein